MDCIVLSTVGQQYNIYTVGVRTIIPRIIVVHPVQCNREILRAGTNVIQIVFVRQRNIKADTIRNRIPRCNTSGISRCGIKDFVRYAVIDCVLRQSFNGVRPARGAIRTPFRYRYAANLIPSGIRYLAGLAINRIGAYNRCAGVAADNNGQAIRTIAARIISVKPIDMAGFGAGITAAG